MNDNPNPEPAARPAVMDRGRWGEINRIFHAALELDPAARPAFVAAQAGGDPRLQAEVEQLLAADSEAGEYLEAPLVSAASFGESESPLAPGDVLCGRFRIVREIAEGGMGHVFEAFDTELAVPIALKVIRPDIAANAEVAARFRQEVRLARSITHPNICRTFDLERETRVVQGVKTDLVFLTMEYLPGETLSARIQRGGAVPFGEALAIARQVASALHAAHALGIVHRDMKPSNIMLVGERAVVTDFGLARMEALPLLQAGDASSLTSRSAGPIGTLAYMAPEQLESAPVSPATDIYAFGLVLFEMVSGKRAFPSGNLLSGIAQRMRGAIALEQQLAPDTPPGWRTAIRACLQVQPEDRPRDAGDVLRLLEANRAETPAPRIFQASRRTLVFAGSILLAVTLLLAGLRLHQWSAPSQVASGALVYLAQVQNRTGEKSFDNLTELMRAGLSQSTQVTLLDQSRVGDILQQMTRSPEAPIDASTAREVAMRGGAARVVFVTVTGSHGAYAMNVDLQQPDAASPARYREHWTKSFAWKTAGSADPNTIPEKMLTSIRAASDWIRHEAGESANDIARLDTPPEDVTTGNWQALAEYTTGQQMVRAGKKDDAVDAFQRAIQADPRFALASAHLGDVLVAMNRRKEGYRAYLNALNADAGQRLSRKERDFIEGSYAADTRDYAAAFAAFRDYSAFYPSDFNAWFYQSLPLQMLNRPEEALQAALQADKVAQTTHAGASEVAYGYMNLEDHANARNWIDIVRRSGHSDQGLFLQALEAFLEHDYDGCERLFSALERSSSKTWRRFGFAGMTRVQAERQQYDDALATLAQEEIEIGAVGTTLDHANLKLDRGYLLCRIKVFDRCVVEIETAVHIDSSPDIILTASDTLGTFLPSMSAGAAARARATLQYMQDALNGESYGVVDELARRRVTGEIDLAAGKPEEALVNFRKADALDAPLRARGYLGRCLLVLASRASDYATAMRLRGEALTAYSRTALHLPAVWRKPKDYPPGFAADEMSDFVRLSRSIGPTDANEAAVESLLQGLRSGPLPLH